MPGADAAYGLASPWSLLFTRYIYIPHIWVRDVKVWVEQEKVSPAAPRLLAQIRPTSPLSLSPSFSPPDRIERGRVRQANEGPEREGEGGCVSLGVMWCAECGDVGVAVRQKKKDDGEPIQVDESTDEVRYSSLVALP
eukprot:1122453-Rhodomonas_salina.3